MTRTQFEERVQPILTTHKVDLSERAGRNERRPRLIQQLRAQLREHFEAVDAMRLETELQAYLADRLQRT